MKRSAKSEGITAVKSAKALLVFIATVLSAGVFAQSSGQLATLGTDQTFDLGSGIRISSLSSVQANNLMLFGQIWGFLKYHHPIVTAGQKNWDYEMLRQLPALLAAPDQRSVAATMVQWIDTLGPLEPCSPCVSDAGSEIHLKAPVDWISDASRLTPALSQRLQAIWRNRSALPKQYYVSLIPPVNNPRFDHEPTYKNVPLSDVGFRLLAVFRFWNIIEYWFPYRDVIGEDWHQALRETISRAVTAPDDAAYQRELMALIARVNDTHANLWSSLGVRPPVGECKVAAHLRFIEGRLVVSSGLEDRLGPLQIGDELVEIDGNPVVTLVREWKPYYAASNEATAERDMGRAATQSDCKDASLIVRRGNAKKAISVDRVPKKEFPAELTHDRPGEPFQMLSDDVAYLKLSNAKKADLAKYISAVRTKGLVVDLRNYPAEFMVLELASMLVTQRTPFVRFTRADLTSPGVFRWDEPFAIFPRQPHYEGKVVVLVDEITQSQAEYTAMALRAVPGALVVGSTTAGADGNFSYIPLPGNLRTGISGIGVFYPDRKPTQRVGIIPDVEVKPTIEGLRAGRDEVLEVGIRAAQGASGR